MVHPINHRLTKIFQNHRRLEQDYFYNQSIHYHVHLSKKKTPTRGNVWKLNNDQYDKERDHFLSGKHLPYITIFKVVMGRPRWVRSFVNGDEKENLMI